MKKNNFEILSILSKREISVLKNEIKRAYNFKGEDRKLDDYIINLYKNDPIKAGKAYDMLNQNFTIKRLFLSKKFEKKLKEYFSQNDKKSQLTFSHFQFLIILPNTKRNNLGWHQDSAYFTESKNQNSTYVCWTPFSMIGSKVNGGLEILQNSNLLGPLKHNINSNNLRKKASLAKRGKLYLDVKTIKNKILNLSIKSGESLFFESNMVHRSGLQNPKINKIRYTIVVRYSNSNSVLEYI